MTNGKKKILIVNNDLATGGVQRSLVNLLHEIKDIYDITLFLFHHSGGYKNCLPAEVKVIEASPPLRLLGMSQAQTGRESYALYCVRAVFALSAKLLGNHLPIRLLVLTGKKLSGFDAAVSFLHNSAEKLLYGGCNEFVLLRVEAKMKITFLHCDFINYGGNTPRNRKVYEYFDRIAVVSEGCRAGFIKAAPELAGKIHYVENCHNYAEYMLKANDNPVEYPREMINIVTVARLSVEKGILRGMAAVNRLIQEGRSLYWHIVGDGGQRREIEDRILHSAAAEFILLYGNQENPYRYMKNADMLLVPSVHEAAPMVFAEAKCLGVPIITTNTASARELVAEGKEGFICENSERGIYEMLRDLLDNPRGLLQCRAYLAERQYTNEKAVLQFHGLMAEGGR